MITRLGRAAADVLSRPALWWAIAALFWLRVAILTTLTPRRPDAELMWRGARAYLTDPAHMYDAAADYLSHLHVIAPPGGLDSFIGPPPLAVLAIPIAQLPMGVGVQVWTGIDAAAMLIALVLLYRLLVGQHPLARPAFWLLAGYFPPMFADVSAGQRGGVLLLGAMASIWLEATRPALAGVAGGLVAALKYYPAAMVIGVSPKHRIRYVVALSAALVVVTVASFIPLGLSGAVFYYQHVLVPSLASYNPDCAYDSVRSLFMRTIGGEQYAQPSGAGYVLVTSPLHLPQVALALSSLSALVFAGAAAWAAWRSGWNPAYGMSVGFALGALIPNEVWPYQWLALLPLVLLLVVRGIEQRKVGLLALLGIFLLGFYRQPCDLIFPNLWTLAGIAIFALGVWENRLFRSGTSREGGYGAQQ
ncbi:MAG TPA: glycosyltransferase family 87 protein [Candidatus Dormibacteraeota bacterium]